MKRAAAFLAFALGLLAVAIYYVATTPWHPTDEQVIEAMLKELNTPTPQAPVKKHPPQSRIPLPATILKT